MNMVSHEDQSSGKAVEGVYGIDREVRRIDNGRLALTCVHELEGVTPEMMLWYFTHRTKERYQMWHPAHLDFRVVSQGGPDHVGDVYWIDEMFTDGRRLDVKLLVVKADLGEFAEKHLSPRQPGGISHRMESTSGGTRVRTTAFFGSEGRMLGPLFNWYLRTTAYKRPVFEAALLHLDDEFTRFPTFLPTLYAEHKADWQAPRGSKVSAAGPGEGAA
jgi:hypothetical protein